MREVSLAKVLKVTECTYPEQGEGNPLMLTIDSVIDVLWVGCHVQTIINKNCYPLHVSAIGLERGLKVQVGAAIHFDSRMSSHHCALVTVLLIEDASDQKGAASSPEKLVVEGMLDGLKEKWPEEVRDWVREESRDYWEVD